MGTHYMLQKLKEFEGHFLETCLDIQVRKTILLSNDQIFFDGQICFRKILSVSSGCEEVILRS